MQKAFSFRQRWPRSFGGRPFALASLGLVLSAAIVSGCPGRRDDPGSGATSKASPLAGGNTTPRPTTEAALPPDLGDKLTPSALSPIALDAPLPPDTHGVEGDTWAMELVFSLRPRPIVSPPTELGAAMSAYAALPIDELLVTLADGRARMRMQGPVGLFHGRGELRAVVGLAGLLHVSSSAAPSYRVVPAGAMRAYFNEGRNDVLPLSTARVTRETPGVRLGRPTSRTTVVTSYGTMMLEQLDAPVPPKPAAFDARVLDAAPTPTGIEGAGEPLCRMLLELLVADRVLGGEPCDPARIPIHVELDYASGGGLSLEATSLKEESVPRADVAFPPVFAVLANKASLLAPPTPRVFGGDEALLALRVRGEPATLELVSSTPLPRMVLVDGVPLVLLGGGVPASLRLRTGSYLVEWRTPTYEVVERTIQVEVPGKSTSTQWTTPLPPLPPPIASAIPSARKGP